MLGNFLPSVLRDTTLQWQLEVTPDKVCLISPSATKDLSLVQKDGM